MVQYQSFKIPMDKKTFQKASKTYLTMDVFLIELGFKVHKVDYTYTWQSDRLWVTWNYKVEVC